MKSIRQIPCPKCGKKALFHPLFSAHDLRTRPARDSSRAQCRICGGKFRRKSK
jgi:hypothetical protein